MNQNKLVDRVKQIFEDQGFQIVRHGKTKLEAQDSKNKFILQVYSSEEFDADQVKSVADPQAKVFVDEDLAKLKEELESQVSVIKEREKERPNFPSFEIIGSIAIVNDLGDRNKDEVASEIREHHGNVETVLFKESEREGEFRTADYTKLAGDSTETVHREHGLEYELDPTKVFFSEREATEREKILKKIDEDERVLVMFAGVGPYPILIADRLGAEVTAIEKNPKAVEYMKRNISRNGVENNVEVLQGDVKNVTPRFEGKFDVIVMPSPTNSVNFLDLALKNLSSRGTIVIYGMSEKPNPIQRFRDDLEEKFDEIRENFKVEDGRIVTDVSPSKSKVRVVIISNN